VLKIHVLGFGHFRWSDVVKTVFWPKMGTRFTQLLVILDLFEVNFETFTLKTRLEMDLFTDTSNFGSFFRVILGCKKCVKSVKKELFFMRSSLKVDFCKKSGFWRSRFHLQSHISTKDLRNEWKYDPFSSNLSIFFVTFTSLVIMRFHLLVLDKDTC
jgi:hypothetical protein